MRCKQLILLFVILLACKKKEHLPILVLGHAGMGLEFTGSVYHANSKEAMDFALANPNCDGVEMDVRLAADGTLWLCHDEKLDGETKSSGCIEDKNFDALKTVRYKTLKNENLALLQDVKRFQKGDEYLFLDIKHYNACQNSFVDLVSFMNELETWKSTIENADQRVYAVLSNHEWVESFLFAGWKVLLSSDDPMLRDQMLTNFPLLDGFMCKNSTCSKNQVEELKSKGKEIFLYEVRSPKALKEVRGKNPTGVLSDDVQGAILEFK